MISFNRRSLSVAMGLMASLGATNALACPACGDTSSYGAAVVTDVGEATQAVLQTTSSVTQAYAETSQALYSTGDDIVGAITASSNAITTEMLRGGEINARLMDALKNRMEQVAQTRLVAETNLEAAKTHGANNLHSSLCEPIGRKDDREQAKAVARELIQGFRIRQVQDRTREIKPGVSDAMLMTAVDLNADGFTEGDAELAMEQASRISGEHAFPISPDTMAAIANAGIANSNDETVAMMAGWMRASSASTDMAIQIAKRARPVASEEGGADGGEPMSLMDELWDEAAKGVSVGGVHEDATAGEVKLLRAIARRGALSNRIRLEQLQTTISHARMNASQIGYLSEQALREMQDAVEEAVIKGGVEQGWGGADES